MQSQSLDPGIGNSSNATGQCVWYGVCSKNKNENLKRPCPYSGPAKKLDDTGLNELKKWCSHLITEENDPSNVETCCDNEQVREKKFLTCINQSV